jgi:hypothetical protein
VKVLLLSTYELGQQPLGISGPAAVLVEAGHEVRAADLSVEPWPEDSVSWAEAVVFTVPMHTATELALGALSRLEKRRSRPFVAWLGLYAPVLEGNPAVRAGDLLAAGESATVLLDWLAEVAPTDGDGATVHRTETSSRATARTVVDIGPPRLPAPVRPPMRELLLPLDRYARYLDEAGSHLSASVEASRGCNHRCRHCPVAAVYRGRSRSLPLESVVADIDQVVALGAEHISFADPDFLNRPAHAMSVARAVHERHPELTFDATVKVEHVLRHAELLPELAMAGLSFVVSAFESTDDAVLALLDKGHSAAEEIEAVRRLRTCHIEVRPSWLPFTPWTSLETIGSILELCARADLVESTDPVQYTIRLLLPSGSLLLADPDPVLLAALLPKEGSRPAAEHGTSRWRHEDERVDELQQAMAGLVETAEAAGADSLSIFHELWALCREAGASLPPSPPRPDEDLRWPNPSMTRPRLSESWFCCAEPTRAQLTLVSR